MQRSIIRLIVFGLAAYALLGPGAENPMAQTQATSAQASGAFCYVFYECGGQCQDVYGFDSVQRWRIEICCYPFLGCRTTARRSGCCYYADEEA